HGSAPEIAGKGLANPIAMIWTIKIMLDFLGHESLGDAVIRGIEDSLESRESLTPDMGGKGTTSQVGDIICNIINKNLS
ncbi:isocitrate/isopropylmalate family dehydrogenase, partial [Ilyobacter sp.]|uniref:isocitrate/isopropylmalate family dehydrogenase n=1 Tax=Ilyobacter sp. TaxID=3100343 RepID=UPI0035654F6E